jgi:uncharacterized protein YjiS (DUF1127 family)
MTMQHSFHTNASPEVGDRALDLQIRNHAAHARQLQAEAVAETMVKVWRGLTRGLRASASWLAEQRRRVQTRDALMACSDRTLADIGIPREHIHLAARGVDLRAPNAGGQAGLRPRFAASIRRLGLPDPEQRRVYRELMTYSDRELDDLGVRRTDIPAIARAA